MHTTLLGTLGLLAALARANLSKPPLEQSLDYLQQGLLDNLHPVHSTWDIWGAGWIPQDCKTMTQNAGLNPVDVETYNVHYDDVSLLFILEMKTKRDGSEIGKEMMKC